MENENNKSIIIILVIISFVLAISNYAAMLIPATASEEFNEVSLFVAPLWTSMFFLFLWKFLNKKALHGFIIGIVVGIVIWFFAAFYSSSNSTEQEAAQDENSAQNIE